MRNISFAKDEYYHIYNRGVDKRSIFLSKDDLLRFLKSMEVFNTIEITGGIYLHKVGSSAPKLVKFIAYCLNQNHYHFILQPLVEDGIQRFMHRLSTGYTNFFNEKYKRSGSLFQGRYKAVHIKTNEQLIHTSVYVNLNNKVHGDLNEAWMLQLPFSSYKQYKEYNINGFCDISVILGQYGNYGEYTQNAGSILVDILIRKDQQKDLKRLILE
jgi:REP element-mobilizing transposase RayT